MASLWDTLADLPAQHVGSRAPTAAVLVPLFEDEEEVVRVVITKRPDHMPSHPGQLAFPGGKIDPVDESVLAAALREADEEVGIRAEQVTPLGFLQPVSTNRFDVVVAPVVGRLDGVPRLIPDPAEVAHTQRVIAAMGDGTGAIMLDGRMEDDASVKQCHVVVELARSLAERDPELAQSYGF